jgi:hypothetical protein
VVASYRVAGVIVQRLRAWLGTRFGEQLYAVLSLLRAHDVAGCRAGTCGRSTSRVGRGWIDPGVRARAARHALAAAFFNLMRQLGGSLGAALLTTLLTRREAFHRDVLTEKIVSVIPDESLSRTRSGPSRRDVGLSSFMLLLVRPVQDLKVHLGH